MRLFNGAQVCAHGNLRHVRKAQVLDCGAQLFGRHLGAELTDKGGRNRRINLAALLECMYGLEDLTLVGDGAKGATDQALAAGNAAVIIDFRMTICI